MMVKNEQLFTLAFSQGSAPEPIKWRRFKSWHHSDYRYLEKSYPDAVAFVPKRDVWFFGFGLASNYHSKDMKLQCKWLIGKDQEKQDDGWFDIEVNEADKDPETKWHTVDIRNLGEKPFKVSEGEWIHVVVRQTTDDYEYRRTFYGYSGYRNEQESIPDQEVDFYMEYSNLNDNGTSDSWGEFPFILYA